MSRKIYTGKKDSNGKRLYVGDKVMMCWGKEYGRDIFRLHTINIKPAHLMSNGEMHDDGGGKIFCLGECYNFWKGNEVVKQPANCKFPENVDLDKSGRLFKSVFAE